MKLRNGRLDRTNVRLDRMDGRVDRDAFASAILSAGGSRIEPEEASRRRRNGTFRHRAGASR